MKTSIGLILLFCLLFVGTLSAQSINIQSDEITWNIDGMTDLAANATVPYQCKFITNGVNTIDWVQDNGNFIMHFSVTNVNGDWSNPAENGSMIFSISGEGLSGQFIVSRSAQGLSAALHLVGGTHEINHSYPVQSYERY
jgi:hypothetical protein